METASCPLCSAAVEAEGLEAHLRFELRLPLLACRLCPDSFCQRTDAQRHFRSEHPGLEVELMKPPHDEAKEGRLAELLRLALGGAEAVERRLCVCGRCRLLCRQGDRPAQPPLARSRDLRPASPMPVRQQDLPVRQQDFTSKGLLDSADLFSAGRPQEYREEDEEDDVANSDARYETDAGEFQSPRPKFKGSPESGMRFSDGMARGHGEDGSPDPAFHFATDIGPINPPANPPKPQALWSATVESEINAENDQELHDHHNSSPFTWSPSESETPSYFGSKPAPKTIIAKKQSSPKASKGVKKSAPKPPPKKELTAARKDFRCRSCAKSVRKTDFKEHASTLHLRKPLYSCRSCDFTSSRSNIGSINRHVKNIHGQRPGEDAVDSAGLLQHAPVLEAMIRKLFEG